MKKFTVAAIALMTFSFASFAQKAKTITGNITANTLWSADTIYTIDGYVYVKNNATLTIQPGTIIKGKSGNRSTLIITMGSKLIADGTKLKPIIFTSDRNPGSKASGDWGGVVLLGKAPTNRPDCNTCPGAAVAAGLAGGQTNIEGDLDNASGDGLYGGTDASDNSGTLRYVRIEYAGVLITTGNEINSLTMGGVGNGTIIENVQCSYGFDDSYEWFGGTVNAKKIIAFGSGDDDFDTDFGFSGKIQYGIILRDSLQYDKGSGPTTNGFESDNDGSGTTATPFTEAVFSNITIVGPYNTSGAGLIPGNSFNNGLRIRRNSGVSLFNSVVMGFPTGVFVDGGGSYNKYSTDTLILKNNIISGYKTSMISNTNQSGMVNKFMGSNGNDTVVSAMGILVDPFNYSNPNFLPANSSPAATGASFTGAKISDAFFTATSYRGAISSTNNWTRCWSEFAPDAVNYSAGPYDIGTKSSPYYKGANANYTFAGTSALNFNFTNTSTKADAFLWDFGVTGSTTDTSTAVSPSFAFPSVGTYTVTLISYSDCGNDTISKQVLVTTGINKTENLTNYSVYPNPTSDNATVAFNLVKAGNVNVELFDLTGRKVADISNSRLEKGMHEQLIAAELLKSGSYFVKINTESSSLTLKFIVVK